MGNSQRLPSGKQLLITESHVHGYAIISNSSLGRSDHGKYIAEVYVPRDSYIMQADTIFGTPSPYFYITNRLFIKRLCKKDLAPLDDDQKKLRWYLTSDRDATCIEDSVIANRKNQLNMSMFFDLSALDVFNKKESD